MAKDPAFLFYTQDFSTGTQFLTDEQVGKYVRLLLAQHQTGHLKMEDMLKICKSHDKDILAKFKEDEFGLFYNERLDFEVDKRKKYSKSRSENRRKNGTYDFHMENENSINSISKVKIGENGKSKFSGNFKAQSEELFAERFKRHGNKVNSDRGEDS